MRYYYLLIYFLGVIFLASCAGGDAGQTGHQHNGENGQEEGSESFEFVADKFADIRVLRYQVPGFELLSLQEKKLLYYLYEAALSGRDIFYDQNYKHNLQIRRSLEAIVQNSEDDGSNDYAKFMQYTKQVWFANGIHHHYSYDKFEPEFSVEWFANQLRAVDAAKLPLLDGETVDQLIAKLTPVIFDPTVDAKKTNKSSDADQVANSAVNFYEGLTTAEVEAYYEAQADPNNAKPVMYGLNTKLYKESGDIKEKVWKMDGMYGPAIAEMVNWLEKAATVAENNKQKRALELLVAYYKSGDLKDFDAYNIAWVEDTESKIDVIHGFIEVYDDPLGYKASYESVVQVVDPEASKRIKAIGAEAQWFEDQSPIMDEHKKENVTGISAKVINVVVEAGATSPSSPIGINLPNSNWIRAQHGSKSVNLSNIVNAYDEASKSSGGSLAEFALTEDEIKNSKEYGYLADVLHTDMHEVIGHASGKLEPGTADGALRNYSSTLEEARADLVGLYYILDQKLVDMGLMPNLQVGRTGCDDFIRNGMMTQLRRIKLGNDIEEDHMRNRQLICHWVYEKGEADKVVERVTKEGKTYFRINDYDKLRTLFGDLMREIQRIKSQGDFEAGKALVENYGVKVDQELHAEVLKRYESLDVSPYSGFINPKLVAVMNGDEITDVKVEYPANFKDQMLYYAEKYSFLPHSN